jgi:hypothetical protein
MSSATILFVVAFDDLSLTLHRCDVHSPKSAGARELSDAQKPDCNMRPGTHRHLAKGAFTLSSKCRV